MGWPRRDGITQKAEEKKFKQDVGNSVGNITYKFKNLNGPNGIRTRVTDVRGRCPRPLDDGTILK